MPVLGIIALFLFNLVLGVLKWWGRMATINTGIIILLAIGFGLAIAALYEVASSYISTLATQAVETSFVAMYLPSNLVFCLGAYTSVVFAGTVYNTTINFLQNKAYIFKA
jgi:hypothetical protein